MRRTAGLVIVLACLAVLVHDAGTGRFSVLRSVYVLADLNRRLLDAVRKDDLRRTQALVSLGGNVNAQRTGGWTPLCYAADNGRADIVAYLLANGADPELPTGNWHPLYYALKGPKSKRIIELLVAHGADVNSRNSGLTPLHMAAEATHCDVPTESLRQEFPELFMQGGSQQDPSGRFGECMPLADVVRFLIQNGADVNARGNAFGTTPLDQALSNQPDLQDLPACKAFKALAPEDQRSFRRFLLRRLRIHKEVIDLLRKHGAKTSKELDAEAGK